MALLPPNSEKPGEKTPEKKSESQARPLGSNGMDTLNTSSRPSAGAGERTSRFASSPSDTQEATPADSALSRLAQRTSTGSGYAPPRPAGALRSPTQGGSGAGGLGERPSALESTAGARSRFSSSAGMSSGVTATGGPKVSGSTPSGRPLSGSTAGSAVSSGGLGGSRSTLSSSALSGKSRSMPESRFSTESSRLSGREGRTSGVTGSLGAGASPVGALGSTAPRAGSFSAQRGEDGSPRPGYGRSATTSMSGAGGAIGTTGLSGTAGARAGRLSAPTGATASSGRLTGAGLSSGALGSSLASRTTSSPTGVSSSLTSVASTRPTLGASPSSGLAVSRDAGGISDEEFLQLQEFIYTQSGIFIADTRKYLVENRLSNRLRDLNLKSFNEYYYYLRFDRNKAEELQKLFNVITTNETSFYRNPPQLKVFQDVVVPQELEKIRASGQRKLRIWSAGCSTGEEPYTLAIILKEVLGSQLSQWDIKITANDLSENVLRAAQRGIYNEYALRTTPPEIIERHFNKEGATFHIDPALKRMVSFGSINLSNKAMLKRVERSHIVFCRNVIIYFDEEMKRQVIESFYDNLLPGGCMLIGHSESLHNLSRAFTPEHYPGTIVYRKQE